jgi:hypothetical protein
MREVECAMRAIAAANYTGQTMDEYLDNDAVW